MWELLKDIFMEEATLSEEDQKTSAWAEAVKHSNWVRLHQMAQEENLEPAAFFDRVAEAYCYTYAAGVEPKRNDAWTSFRKTLEHLHYPLLSDAISHRAKEGL